MDVEFSPPNDRIYLPVLSNPHSEDALIMEYCKHINLRLSTKIIPWCLGKGVQVVCCEMGPTDILFVNNVL